MSELLPSPQDYEEARQLLEMTCIPRAEGVINNIAHALAARGSATASRLLFSQREALNRAGVPTTSPEGAPVSDGWRAAWAAEELIRVRAELVEQRAFVVGIEASQRHEREEGARLMRAAVLTAIDSIPESLDDGEHRGWQRAREKAAALGPAAVVRIGS